MHSGEILSFMDFLDLDEELIDRRAKNLMEKSSFTNEHFGNFINLLMYKQLINTREEGECCNEKEYSFVTKLINNVNEDNIDIICKVIKTILILNPSTIVDKSEHLIQQILFEIKLPVAKIKTSGDGESDELGTTLMHLKVCGSILDAVLQCGYKLSLPFLEIPLEHIVCCQNEALQVYFLTNTVTRFFEAIIGYNILDRLWNFLRQSDNAVNIALKVLSCLSNYYLPIEDSSKSTILESDVIFHGEFWDFVLSGLSNKDNVSSRKHAVYLAKRALDCAFNNDKYIKITSQSTFRWDYKNKMNLKKKWDDYFILIDTLDEKQSNIVLPSLKLFDAVKDIGHCWLNCAFNIGLHHDNTQVRFKCLDYRLEFPIKNENEAVHLLETINDINLFEDGHAIDQTLYKTNIPKPLKTRLKENFLNTNTLINVLKVMPLIKWSPVPLYHLTTVMADIKIEDFVDNTDHKLITDIISEIIKIPCNNTIMRTAAHINISYFIGNCCKGLHWNEYISLYTSLQLDSSNLIENPFIQFVQKELVVDDKKQLLQYISFSTANIDFAITYFETHNDLIILDFINDIVMKIQNINSRQYANKTQCIEDVIFLVQFHKKTMQRKGAFFDQVTTRVQIVVQTILEYVRILLSSTIKDVENVNLLFEGLDSINNEIKANNKETLLQLYKSAVLLIKDHNTDLEKKSLAIFVINSCLKAPVMLEYHKHEILDLETFLDTVINVKFNENLSKESRGRARNAFFEKSCEIVYFLINKINYEYSKFVPFIDCILERGGYGCLKWIIRITSTIFPKLLQYSDLNFDVTQFFKKIWTEIEELKSNSQYSICIEEFIKLVIQEALLKMPEYNNIVILYCNKIIEYAALKNAPLYYLVKQMNEINISNYSHMIYVLNEVLLNSSVPRKDHRITERVTVQIFEDSKYGIDENSIILNSDITIFAILALSKITDTEILNTLTALMMKKVDEMFSNKQRYYANSQHERALQACVQNMLLIFLKSREVDMERTLAWVIEFFGRVPHQAYVRTCFEWYISLYFYTKSTLINDKVLNELKAKNVPLQSQFKILYWLVKRKLKTQKCRQEEFEYVMDFLLSNIMGPIYSIRLHAQYLSTKLYEMSHLDNQKYSYIIKVIQNILTQATEAKDKSFMKVLTDYFFTSFDIVEDLTPCGIYRYLPHMNDCYTEIGKHYFNKNFFKVINDQISEGFQDMILSEWKNRHMHSEEIILENSFPHKSYKDVDDVNCEEMRTIQKKYVPWKNMSDIEVYEVEKKNNKSNLIVVASLIDKLPNLGGMARTSEVFGVKTYVMDSLRHIQDKKFQGLSVSAERWINVEEVRPANLKDYLMKKKSEGFSIVAAEQTSNSKPLQNFKFPEKTLLLLGHEKEGVPCDLLPLMDECVEIPQKGVIRSLNVHVTAAIFIWEYARQNNMF